MKVERLDHVATLHICSGDSPLRSAHDAACALVECEFTHLGRAAPSSLYASAIPILIHLAIVALVAVWPFLQPANSTKKMSDLPKEETTLKI